MALKVLAAILFLTILSLSRSEDLYNIKSNVTPLNSKNFQKQITSQRIRDVNIVFFYKEVGIVLGT